MLELTNLTTFGVDIGYHNIYFLQSILVLEYIPVYTSGKNISKMNFIYLEWSNDFW